MSSSMSTIFVFLNSCLNVSKRLRKRPPWCPVHCLQPAWTVAVARLSTATKSADSVVCYGKIHYKWPFLMGKSPFLMGKSTISTGPCSIAMLIYQRVKIESPDISPGWWWLRTYDDIWWHMMTYDDIWWHMMTYDDIWWHMMTSGIPTYIPTDWISVYIYIYI